METCLMKDVRGFLSGKFSFDSKKNAFESYLDAYYIKKRHMDRLTYVTEKILPFIKPGSRILDLGSDGIFPFVVKNFVGNVEAYAVSKRDDEIFFSEDGRAYSYRDTGLENLDVNPEHSMKIKGCDLDKDKLPFEDNSMDIVTCFEVIEHLLSDPMNMLLEVNRVLKRNEGIFFLSTPNINSLKSLKRLLKRENPYFWPPYSCNDAAIGHVKEYSIKELKLLFEKSGFSVLMMDTFNHKEDEKFSHDKYYQIGIMPGIEEETNEPNFRFHLSKFLEAIHWDSKFQGDYILIGGEWKSEIKERYCFPIYETY